MRDYNFGNVNIEFNTNKIFLLLQILYRMEALENKINLDNSDVSYLADSIKEFKRLVDKNQQGLKEFNQYQSNAENKNMWAEYGEYIASFAQMNRKELKTENPEFANAVEELLNCDFFLEAEKLNDQYSDKMEARFEKQTQNYQKQSENIVGKTNTKKIIYMPFTPKLFSIEPCCLADKNGNGEYAVPFTIPTDKGEFEETFGMEYTEGIESVILFHEKLHADIPTKSVKYFKNPMQRELDSHLKHTIIELLANGEMGINMANHSSFFQSIFHTGKIYDGQNVLTTNDLQEFGITDHTLLHTEANENTGKGMKHFSKEDLGIIKVRGMVYPYVLMYLNRNSENPLEHVLRAIQRDTQMLKNIYGEDFLRRLQEQDFLEQVQTTVKTYDNLLGFAEGMSKELLGIELLKEFGEQQIGKATINIPTSSKDMAQSRLKRDERQIMQEVQK